MEVEAHPFEPFLPEGARLLMLGTCQAVDAWHLSAIGETMVCEILLSELYQ